MHKRIALLTLLVVAALGAPANADPVNITGGNMLFQRQELGGLVLHGDGGWSLNAVFGTDESYYPGIETAPMPEGTYVALSTRNEWFIKREGLERFVQGSFTTGGTQYWLDSLDFRVDDLRYVRIPSDSAGVVTWTDTTRFNFRAYLWGTSDLGARMEAQLTGRGSARLATLDNFWFASEYNFDNQAPVPEPGTLLLFATGAAAVIRRRLTSG